MNKTNFIFIAIVFALSGCDITKNDVEPTASFTKIYDDNRFEQEYYPVDIIETADKGFLILSELKNDQSLFTSVHILKTDALGNIVSQIELDAPFANAVNGWSKVGELYYFVCMNANNLIANLVAVDETGTPADPIALGSTTYPLVMQQVDNGLVLLSFDNLNAESVITELSVDGQIIRQVGYPIGTGVDVEKPIIDHLTRNGDKLPFTVGKTTDGIYYFNGFYNFTFSLVFTNFGTDPTGVSQGQLSQGGISAVSSLGNDVFGIARFNFGANFINPTAIISTSSITSSIDLGGNTFPEIESGARVSLINTPQGRWIYGTNTQGKQVSLYGFDQTSNSILGTEYLGGGNPYTFSSFTLTSDGGIAILANTALEGRFPRIALFKRDADFLRMLVP